MKLKLSIILITCILLNACATTPVNIAKINDCTGLDIITVNGFDKKSHLFNRNDSYYVRRYEPKTFVSNIELRGCQQNDTGKRVILSTPAWYTSVVYGHYYPQDAKVFNLFISWLNQNPKPQSQALLQINQQLAGLKTQVSTVPKKQADWYVDIEQHTGEPVLVSNARDPDMHGAFANRTLALTKENVINILANMNNYWSK